MLPQDDPLGRISTIDLYQPFLGKLADLANACAARGAHYFATCGERTWDEQAKIYAVGRTTGTPGHFLTKAAPGKSPHNYAIAVDWALDANWGRAGLKPDYRDASYRVLAEEAEKLGLDAGFYWAFRDTPHVQLPIKKYGIRWADLEALYRRGGKEAVFAELDRHRW